MATEEEDRGTEDAELRDSGPDGVQDQGRRPTPVRQAMDGGDQDGPGGEERRTRSFSEGEDGEEWVVTVTGRSGSGVLPLRSVSLLELTFARADAPERPLRSTLTHGINLADLSEEELRTSLARSEPFREPMRLTEEKDKKRRRKRSRGAPDS